MNAEKIAIEEIKKILNTYNEEVATAECTNDIVKAKEYAFNRVREVMQSYDTIMGVKDR